MTKFLAVTPAPNPLTAFILPIGFLVIFYFTVIKPQKKRDQEIRDMRNKLSLGDKIITIGGIKGEIIKITEDDLVIKTGKNDNEIEIVRWAVAMKQEELEDLDKEENLSENEE